MKITEKKITVKELVENYQDLGEKGVFGYNNRLVIRPAYQREFVYKDKQRNAVIESVRKGFPLNVMYWSKVDEDQYEVLDGQQRTISLAQYLTKKFPIKINGNDKFCHNLSKDELKQIEDYELTIYICEGSEAEKLDWFRIINIAGERLTDQELLNAAYTGSWLSDAKKYFSATGCKAELEAKDYVSGSAIRQDYLEKALQWISAKENCTIDNYMAQHQHDSNAGALWGYFNGVINWAKTNFKVYRKEMKSVPWGLLFNEFGNEFKDSNELESRVKELMEDDEITKKSGIYEYLITGNERALSLRAFSDKMKREAYEKQNGCCVHCHEHFEIKEMQGDHIVPWSKGGRTTADNCQMLCSKCNNEKSNN